MGGLWTPDGDRPAPPREVAEAAEALEELTEEELAERMEILREQLAQTPVGEIVAQSAYQFFELGALHLSVVPPQLSEAKVAIDALGLLVEGLGEALGPNVTVLRDGLQQIRMAYVAVSNGGQLPTDG